MSSSSYPKPAQVVAVNGVPVPGFEQSGDIIKNSLMSTTGQYDLSISMRVLLIGLGIVFLIAAVVLYYFAYNNFHEVMHRGTDPPPPQTRTIVVEGKVDEAEAQRLVDDARAKQRAEADPLDNHPFIFHESLRDRHPLFVVDTPTGGFRERADAREACDVVNARVAKIKDIHDHNKTIDGELQFFDFAWIDQQQFGRGLSQRMVDVARPYSAKRDVEFLVFDETHLPMGEFEPRQISKYPRVQGAKADANRAYPVLCTKRE